MSSGEFIEMIAAEAQRDGDDAILSDDGQPTDCM